MSVRRILIIEVRFTYNSRCIDHRKLRLMPESTPLKQSVTQGLTPAQCLIETGQRMVKQNLVQATAGNISVLTSQCEAPQSASATTRSVWVSGSGYNLGYLCQASVAHMALTGERLDAHPCKPSSEWPIHQAIYHANPDIGAVIHSHPIAATARAIAHQPLVTPYVAEAMVLLGPVPVLPYCQPGGDALAQQVAQALTQYSAVMLANHGVVVVGTDLQDAYYRLELLEATAQMVSAAGEHAVPLTREQVAGIWAKYGNGSPRHQFAERVFLSHANG